MILDEIKAAVDAGQTVQWANTGYVVQKDRLGQYLITYLPNGMCGWLLHSKTFLIRFVHLSEAVMCPACLRGLDRWP